MIVGKGVTYDTGGVSCLNCLFVLNYVLIIKMTLNFLNLQADIKVGGMMAGMSRDKIGASNVAGFMKVVSMLKPSKVNCILPILVSCTDHF